MAVLVAVVEARPIFDSEPSPIALPAVADPADLPTLLDALRAASDEDGTAVLVIPRWGQPRLREVVDGARMLLGPRRLTVVETSLPPLAASVAASVLTAVVRRLGAPHEGALLFPLIERQTVSLAWVSSVTGLGHLDVSFRLHMRSYLTRSGFVARTNPDPLVLRAGDPKHPLTVSLPPRPRVVVGDRDGDLSWYSQHLLPKLNGAPISMVHPSQGGTDWWGTKRLTEIVAFCGDLDLLTEAMLDAVKFELCPWCGATAIDVCRRCGASTRRLATTKEMVE